jgi:hypothetical protein
MVGIGTVDLKSIGPVLDTIKGKTSGCRTLEEAAQRVADALYGAFGDSIALVRLFGTVPYGELPAANRQAVAKLAETHGITSLMRDETLVLSLLGTRGSSPAWNDRRKSEGHVGVPLASADFIDQIPMMSRLLKEIGLSLDWITSGDTSIVVKAMGSIAGVFFVPDASSAVDTRGRKVIAAQDFVRAHQVRSVFGIAGAYTTSRMFVTMIVFCRETLQKTQAELFSPVINAFKGNTMALASKGAIFN